MNRPDEIVNLIDGGLQTSGETGYGTDRARDLCARCQAAAPEPDGDLCGPCRAFLLGDSEVDPIPGPPAEDEDSFEVFLARVSVTVGEPLVTVLEPIEIRGLGSGEASIRFEGGQRVPASLLAVINQVLTEIANAD